MATHNSCENRISENNLFENKRISQLLLETVEEHEYEDVYEPEVKSLSKNQTFYHLYQEKFYFLGNNNQQSICTGLKPDRKRKFRLHVRIDDHRYSTQILLTMFQYVRMMKDLRNLLLTPQQNHYFDRIDGNITFKFKEMSVPRVVIEARPNSIVLSHSFTEN